jgi:hypothetical protein
MPSDLRRTPDLGPAPERSFDRGSEDPAIAFFRTELQAAEKRIAKRVGARIWLAMLLTWIVLGGLAVVLFAAVVLGR